MSFLWRLFAFLRFNDSFSCVGQERFELIYVLSRRIFIARQLQDFYAELKSSSQDVFQVLRNLVDYNQCRERPFKDKVLQKMVKIPKSVRSGIDLTRCLCFRLLLKSIEQNGLD